MGDSCEEDDTNILFCQVDSCSNGGTCNEQYGPATSCMCMIGFMGLTYREDDSDTLFCQENTCTNGGTCIEGYGSAISCDCRQGFTGRSCSERTELVCPSEESVPIFTSSSIFYDWSEAKPGETRSQSCPEICDTFLDTPSTGVIVRECRLMADGIAQWQEIDMRSCGFSSIALLLCETSQVQHCTFLDNILKRYII